MSISNCHFFSEDPIGLSTIWRYLWNSPNIVRTCISFARRSPCAPNVLLKSWKCSKFPRLFGDHDIFNPILFSGPFWQHFYSRNRHIRHLSTKKFLSNSPIGHHARQLVAKQSQNNHLFVAKWLQNSPIIRRFRPLFCHQICHELFADWKQLLWLQDAVND